MKLSRYFIYLLVLLIAFGCVDIPDEVALPEYDVKFTVPIADRTYTLEEAIEDDTANIKWSKNPDDYGLLYFTDEITIEKIDVKNNIKIDPFTTTSGNVIGVMKLSDVNSIETEINYAAWGLTVSEGSMKFPAFNKDVNTNFTIINSFLTATFENSQDPEANILTLTLSNKYPVEIELNGLQIFNQSNEIIVETTDLITIPSGGNDNVSFNLGGKKVTGNVIFKSQLSTPGSGDDFVTVTNSDKLEIEASFSPKLLISSANAKLPAQDIINKLDSFLVDDSTKLSSAKIKNGSFSLSFENELDVKIDIYIKVNSLVSPQGTPFERSITILRNSTADISDVDLSGYTIVPNDDGELEYTYSFESYETSDYRVVNKNQGVFVDADFSEVTFSSVAGQIKPIDFEIDEKSTSLDIGEFKDKLNYNNINVEKANVILKLNTSANVDMQLDASVNVEYPDGEKRSESFSTLVPSQNNPVINFANLINNTSGQLPDEFTITGSAIVNPDYETNVSISDADTVGGTAVIEIPLNAQVLGGTIIDTIDIDEIDIDDEDAERLNLAELTIEIENGIAAGGTFSGILIDEFGDKLMDIPPREVLTNGTTSDLITLNAPVTDQNGDVIQPGYTSQKIQIYGEDVKKFIRGKQLILNINFDTASNSDKVKFKYTDQIKVSVIAEATIKVSE